jgi:hypothetical protein
MGELIGLLQSIHALSPQLEEWLRSVIKQEWFLQNDHLASFLNVSERTYYLIRKDYSARKTRNKSD